MMRLTRRASLFVVIYVGGPRAICHRPPPASPADRGRDRARMEWLSAHGGLPVRRASTQLRPC